MVLPSPIHSFPAPFDTQHRDSREIPVTAESIRTRSSATSSRLHAWRAEKSSASLTHMDEPITATSPIRLLLHGANGRMGQALLRLAAEQPDAFTLVGAVSRKVGQRVIDGVPQFASSELAAAPEFDVVIDFSLPEAFDGVLALLRRARRARWSAGRRGCRTRNAPRSMPPAQRIPVLWASNFSLGVAVLADLVERAARALPGWDCDIVEQHHVRKLDAPSGTALTLGDAAGQGGRDPALRIAARRRHRRRAHRAVRHAGRAHRADAPRDQPRHLRPRRAPRRRAGSRAGRPRATGSRDLPAADRRRRRSGSIVCRKRPASVQFRLACHLPARTGERRVRALLQPAFRRFAARGIPPT